MDITEAKRQRDKARRQLAHARQLLRDLMTVHTADMESYEEENSPCLRVWARCERFLAKPR